jgi:hypothetical protein
VSLDGGSVRFRLAGTLALESRFTLGTRVESQLTAVARLVHALQLLVRELQSVPRTWQSDGTRVQRLVRSLQSPVRLVGSLPRDVQPAGTPVERLVRLLQVSVRLLDRIYRLLDVCHGLLDRR